MLIVFIIMTINSVFGNVVVTAKATHDKNTAFRVKHSEITVLSIIIL